MELDRHSYEIQIKELSQKIEEMDSLKSENSKLKEFIKKQGVLWYLTLDLTGRTQTNFKDQKRQLIVENKIRSDLSA